MTDTVVDPLTQSDDTDAFGSSLMQVSLKNPLPAGVTVSKAVIAIGPIRKTFENPTFPFVVNLNSEETAKLQCGSQVYMACWDGNGKKKTCKGHISLATQPRKV